MPNKRGKEVFQLKRKKTLFSKGPVKLVDCSIQMPSGKLISRQIFEHPGCVVIVPRISKDRYLLIRQFRYATGGWIWEWPAGGIERGETLRQGAQRELMEEAGYRAGKITPLFHFYPTPGVSQEMMHLFLAENLKPGSLPGDEDEEVEVHEFSFRQIEKMIEKKQILDAKTILGAYYLRLRRL